MKKLIVIYSARGLAAAIGRGIVSEWNAETCGLWAGTFWVWIVV